MKLITTDTGVKLNANFSLEGSGSRFDLILHSRGGTKDDEIQARNSDYIPGLEVILTRLGQAGACLVDAVVDSSTVKNLTAAGRRMEMPSFRYPIQLQGVSDIAQLRAEMGSAQPGIGQAPGAKGGNPTKKIRLTLLLPTPWELAQLEQYLSLGDRTEALILTLVDDPAESIRGFRDWHNALRAYARSEGNQDYYFPVERIRLRLREKIPGEVPKGRFGAGDTTTGWIVQINPPASPGREDGTSSVATDSYGRRWLLRQGRLQKNRESNLIVADEFRRATGLLPVQVKDAAREWFVVAPLDTNQDEICFRTLNFVARCEHARHYADSPDIVDDGLIYGNPEGSTPYMRSPREYLEREVRRRQGEVWIALSSLLDIAGKKLLKPRHAQGYEVDGTVDASPLPFLIEIKMSYAPESVYAGVGQLHLYRKLMPALSEYRPILLVPQGIGTVVTEAITQLGIIVETYEEDATGEAPSVKFSASLLDRLGLLNSGSRATS